MDEDEGDSEQGAEWTDPEVRAKAEELLARRNHSRSELQSKLREREIPEESILRICGRLERDGVLDDAAFARRQARMLRDRDWGPRQIRRKLREHGVSEDDRDAALREVGGEEVWLRHCYEQFQSEFGGQPSAMSRDEKGKAFRHLKRRGFDGWTARRVVLDGYEPDASR
jgi:regulatory protein